MAKIKITKYSMQNNRFNISFDSAFSIIEEEGLKASNQGAFEKDKKLGHLKNPCVQKGYYSEKEGYCHAIGFIQYGQNIFFPMSKEVFDKHFEDETD